MKTKDYKLDVSDIDAKQGIVVRYASSFNVVDSYGDRTMPGCFTQTIKNWGPKSARPRIKSLFQHDPSLLVAKPLEIIENSKGLLVTDQFSKTAFAQDILTLIKEGIITESSIGFSTKKDKANDFGGYDLEEVVLYESSYCTWGANQDTPIISAKNLELVENIKKQDDLFAQMKRFESALRNSSFETDEVPIMLELALAMWESKAKEFQKEPEVERIEIKAAYDYGSTHFEIGGATAEVIRELQGKIKKGDIKQLEDQLHITVRYGLLLDEADDALEPILATVPPVKANLNGLGVFANPEADVLYIKVESDSLMALNEALQALPGKPSDYETYTPHLTLAYLKPGTAQAYVDSLDIKINNVTLDCLVYSDRHGSQEKFELSEIGEESAPADVVMPQGEGLTDEENPLDTLLMDMEIFKIQQKAQEFISTVKGN